MQIIELVSGDWWRTADYFGFDIEDGFDAASVDFKGTKTPSVMEDEEDEGERKRGS